MSKAADRPLVVAPPADATLPGAAGPSPSQSVAHGLTSLVADSKATSGDGHGHRAPTSLLVALALALGLVAQRGEATRDLVEQQTVAQAATAAAWGARADAIEKALAEETKAMEERQARSENLLREALYVLAEDSRAAWDAQVAIHSAVAPKAPALRQPDTAGRLAALRAEAAGHRVP